MLWAWASPSRVYKNRAQTGNDVFGSWRFLEWLKFWLRIVLRIVFGEFGELEEGIFRDFGG